MLYHTSHPLLIGIDKKKKLQKYIFCLILFRSGFCILLFNVVLLTNGIFFRYISSADIQGYRDITLFYNAQYMIQYVELVFSDSTSLVELNFLDGFHCSLCVFGYIRL